MTSDEAAQRMKEFRQKAMQSFPLKLVETAGNKALEKWQELKAAGQGSPIVLGGNLDNLLDPFGPGAPPEKSVGEILQDAAGIRFPDDLAKLKKAETVESMKKLMAALGTNPNMRLPTITKVENGPSRTFTREETIAAMLREPQEPPLGNWPDQPNSSMGLSVATELLSARRLRKSTSGSPQLTIGQPSRPISGGAAGMNARPPDIMSPPCGHGVTAMMQSSLA